MESLLLPLFPLELVLFPGQSISLHIFEDRYKEMIGECLENQTEFGIVLAGVADKDNSIANQGCTAVVTSVTRRYDDGRMDIEVGGRRRFEVLFLDQARSFLRAAAQFFDDEEPGEKLDPAERLRVLKMHSKVLELLFTDAAERQGNEVDPKTGLLSFAMIAPLPVDNDFKQSLLGLRSEGERMERVIDCLEKLLQHLTLISKVRARAGANGHGR
jgi:Lon protease-like protein